MEKSAIISDCGIYRYELRRTWDQGAWKLGVIMLNPSTADHEEDDPTIRRVIGFAKAWGYGGIVVFNLFALRATNPKELKSAASPIGPENDEVLGSFQSGDVLCAWGANGRGRAAMVIKDLRSRPGVRLVCLGKTKSGAPRHPLYVRADTKAERF